MSDSSEDELPLERAQLTERVSEFDFVPSSVKYKFKLKNKNGKSYSFFEYELAAGKKLPYETVLKGEYLLFRIFIF